MIHFFDITYIISTYGYVGIFIIVFLESGLIFALPGDSLLLTAGLLASTSVLNIYILIPVIFVATFLGGMMGYEVGVHLVKLQKFKFFARFLKQEYIDEAHRFFDKHGKAAIIFSRFVVVVRTFIPIVAGVARMHYGPYLRYSLIGSLIWSFVMTLVGYYLGQVFPGIKEYLTYIIIIVVILSILPMIWEIFQNKKK